MQSPGLSNFCVAVMLAVGLFLPTSIDGEISKPCFYFGSALLTVLFGYILLSQGTLARLQIVICSILVNALLLFWTLLSPLTEFAVGAYAYYFLLSVMLCLNLRRLRFHPWMMRVPVVISVVLVAIAFSVILHVEVVKDTLVANYSTFYPELVVSMLAMGKPVLTFGSHSLAGFFFYLFFLFNFRHFTRRGSKLSFVLALIFIGLSIPLQSVTSYLFVAFAAGQIVVHFSLHRRRLMRLTTVATVLAIAVFAVQDSTVQAAVSAVGREVIKSNTNGLGARYTAQGTLAPNIAYILEHPFAPTGLRYSSELWYVDSGPVEYVLRGSVLLALAIYAGFFLFLRANLTSRSTAYLVFGVYTAFEVGFSNLVYLRTLYFIPFLIVYLNTLESSPSPSQTASVRGMAPEVDSVVTT